MVSHKCYGCRMALTSNSVPSRVLRNETRSVLDRVRSGDSVTITVDGIPVAVIEPIRSRPTSMPRDEFLRVIAGHQADAGLRDDLAEIAGELTDENDPW
jgi:prevent-host-death family protein